MGIEFCLVNLGNTGQYDYYNASNTEELKEAYRDFRHKFYADEIEVQSMSHNQFIADNMDEIFELMEEEDCNLEDVINIINACGSMAQTKEVIKNYSFQYIEANNKENAFIEYIEELDYLRDIPEHLASYIDYKKLMRDFEIEGLIIHEYDFENYIFIN